MTAQQAPRANATGILDDYNPFEDEDKTKKSQYNEGSTNITVKPPSSPPQIPAYNQSSQSNQAYGGAAPQISTAELQVRIDMSVYACWLICL